MSRLFAGVLTALVAVVMTLGAVQDAEAKRLGGGKSFGSRPGYSQPYQRSTPPSAASPAASAATSRAVAQNATQRQALSNRGGLMGMLGGLALGGLLGALFFGGAFENLNLFDIAVFVGLAALAYFLFAHFRRRAAAAAPSGGDFGRLTPAGTGADEPVVRRQSGAEGLRSGGWRAAADVPQEGPVAVPEGFDTVAFLNGAKRAYHMLQEAWDRGDLSELRGLTTDDVFAVYDVNKDGKITQDEFVAHFKDKQKAATAWKKIDTDNNGFVERTLQGDAPVNIWNAVEDTSIAD